MTCERITRLEKIADSFIDDYLKDHPIMFYSIDVELKEYLVNIEELNDTDSVNGILRNI
jgi:hypothetical protein